MIWGFDGFLANDFGAYDHVFAYWGTKTVSLSESDLVQRLLEERVRLLAYIWAIVRDSHVAEDVFQEVSLLAVRKRSEIVDQTAFPVWLRKSARFCALARSAGAANPRCFSATRCWTVWIGHGKSNGSRQTAKWLKCCSSASGG